MALRLVSAGLPTTVFDVAENAVRELVEAGAVGAVSPADLARTSDVIGICVRNDDDVRTVVSGSEGLLSGAASGTIIAIHSTVLPSTVLEIGELAAEHGVGVIDACVTGGAGGADQGTLTYMVGGTLEHLERCRPALETSAAKIIHTGELGSGAGTKLCNNLMTYLGFLSAFEATSLARSAGLSDEALESVARSNGNMTDQMMAFLILHKIPEEQRHNEDFQKMLEGFTGLAEKDLAATLEFARENGLELPGAEFCRDNMARVYGLDEKRRR
jgi:3-hydroxyisobutyrate dehydrogenase